MYIFNFKKFRFDIGERVLIQGGKAGVCKFLDRINNELTAGILLDRPMGTCNGNYQVKYI